MIEKDRNVRFAPDLRGGGGKGNSDQRDGNGNGGDGDRNPGNTALDAGWLAGELGI